MCGIIQLYNTIILTCLYNHIPKTLRNFISTRSVEENCILNTETHSKIGIKPAVMIPELKNESADFLLSKNNVCHAILFLVD